ncbi:MAG: polysaccharide deacetylase family protein [Bacteroidota bacterium]
MQDSDHFPGQDVCEGATQNIRTLVYHRITDNLLIARENPRCVYESVFRRHLDLLDRWGFTTITFRDYRLFQQGNLHLPKKPVILTLEGGHADTYRVAFPALLESGSHAVVFALAGTPEAYTGRAADHPASSQMSFDQLREMSAEGMEIGSLSLTYPNLLSLPPARVREEIVRSKDNLERILDAPVLTFSYPYGKVTDALKKTVAEARYAFACCWSSGSLRFDADPLEIRRLTVRGGMGSFELGLTVRAPQVARALWGAGS